MSGLKEYPEDSFLMLSGIQHFLFCRRQWALIHIEQAWSDNYLTTSGNLMHDRAHNEGLREKRGDKITVRGLAIHSAFLGISGQCDVVEFTKDENGISLSGEQDKWQPFPVEYKHGSPKDGNFDTAQLCAQAMCLEEMLSCDIQNGALFYGETKHRLDVEFTEELRKTVKDACEEMHKVYQRGYTPMVKMSAKCRACSLKELCVPVLSKSKSVSQYIEESKE